MRLIINLLLGRGWQSEVRKNRCAGTNGEGDFSSRVSPGSLLPITAIGVGECGVLAVEGLFA